MTLAELIAKAQAVNSQISTAWIPIKYEGQNINVRFDLAGNSDRGYVVNMIIEKL